MFNSGSSRARLIRGGRRSILCAEPLELRRLLSVAPTNDCASATDFVVCGSTEVRQRDTFALETALLETLNAPTIDAFVIDWGDGVVETVTDSSQLLLHTFAEVGPQSIQLQAIGANATPIDSVSFEVDVRAASAEVIHRSDEGLTAELFSAVDPLALNLPTTNADVIRQDTTLNFDFGQGSPDNGIASSDHFGIRWTGTLKSVDAADYSFHATTGASDFVRVWIDDQLVVDTWGMPTDETITGHSALAADAEVDIQVEYLAGTGDSQIQLRWETSLTLNELIPTAQLSPAMPILDQGVLRESWNGIVGATVADLVQDSDYVANTPDHAVTDAEFEFQSTTLADTAHRTRAILTAPQSGYFTFQLSASSAAELRLGQGLSSRNATRLAFVETPTALRQFDDQPSQTSLPVYLVEGEPYYVELLQAGHAVAVGDAHASVSWTRPDAVSELIPAETLQSVRPEVTLSAEVSEVNEAEAFAELARFVVSRHDDLGRDLTVTYTVGGSASNGVDYAALSGSVVIPKGSSTAVIEVDPVDDGLFEGAEEVVIRLAASDEYWLAAESQQQAIATIRGETPEGTPLLPVDAELLDNISETAGDATFSNASTELESVPFSSLLEVNVNSFTNSYDVRTRWIIPTEFEKNDAIVLTGYLRSNNADESNVEAVVRFESASDFLLGDSTSLTAGTQWTPFAVPFEFPSDFASNDLRFDLRYGFKQQSVQVGGLKLVALDRVGQRSLLPVDAASLDKTTFEFGDANFTDIDVSDPAVPFDHGLRVEVLSFTNPWDVRPVWSLEADVGENTPVTVRGYLRSANADGSDASAEVRLEMDDAPYLGESRPLVATSDWQPFEVQLLAPTNYVAREFHVDLRLGFALQTVEFAGIEVLTADFPLDEVPRTKYSYGDRELSAAWRGEAEAAVQLHRTSDMRIVVENAHGVLVDDATVTVELVRPEFELGSTVYSAWFSETTGDLYHEPDSARYRALTETLFQRTVDSGSTQWVEWLRDPLAATETAQWANQRQLTHKGHSVAWGRMTDYPAPTAEVGFDLAAEYADILDDDGEEEARDWLKQVVLDNATFNAPAGLNGTIGNSDEPMIAEWDVINHPLLSHEIWDIVGQSFMTDVIQATRAVVHSDTELYINENEILTGVLPERTDDFHTLISELLTANAALDGIGFQSHFQSDKLPSVDEVLFQLDRFGQHGLDMQISEFDIDAKHIDLQTQADFTRDYLLVALSRPQVTAFNFWGFWADHHWRDLDDAELVTTDFEVRPNAQVMLDFSQQLQPKRVAHGSTIDFNGVDGVYDVMVTRTDGTIAQQQVTLDPQSGVVRVVFPDLEGPPLAEVDEASTAEDQPVSIGEATLLANDYLGTLPTAVSSFDSTTLHGGSVERSIDEGEVVYVVTPSPDFVGTDSFSYTLSDADGERSSTVVYVDVSAESDVVDDVFTVLEDTLLTGDVALNDLFAGTATYAVNTDAAHGTVEDTGGGAFSYTPVADFVGSDTFTYTATDAHGVIEAGSVTVSVTSVPDVVDDVFTVLEDTLLTGDVALNDLFVGSVSYAVNTDASHGTVVDTGAGAFIYTPVADFVGEDTFTYTATDAHGVIETGSVTVSVTSVSDVVDDVFTVLEDTLLTGDVALNDLFVGAATYAVNTDAAHGTVVDTGGGAFSYMPVADFVGEDTFTYTATDAHGVIETGSVTVSVTSVSDVVDDVFTVLEDTLLTGDVALNDLFVGSVTYAVNTDAAHGTVADTGAGAFSYMPVADFVGEDTFTYTATDTHGVIETGSVTVSVTSVSDVVDDVFTVLEDTLLTGDVALNDLFVGSVSYAVNTDAAHGTVVDTGAGAFSYTPVADFVGSDTFTYTATDAHGVIETGSVTVSVTSVSDVVDDVFTVLEDTLLTGDVALNDLFVGSVSYAVNTDAAHGTVVDTGAGAFSYTPVADFVGSDTFTYTATDAHGVIETGSVTVSVTSVPDVVDDVFTVLEDTVLIGDVSTNDSLAVDASYLVNDDATHGSVIDLGEGVFRYTPSADFAGSDAFTYAATDTNGLVESGQVTVTITAVADVVDDVFVVAENDVVSGDVSDNDLFAGDATYVVNSDAQHGSVVDNGLGSFSYTPDSDYAGVDSFSYLATDGNGNVESGLVTIDVEEDTTGPKLAIGVLSDVTNAEWRTVTLPQEYASMVVIATPSYSYASVPLVTRIRNASGNQFEVRVDRTDDSSSLASAEVYYMVVEEGVYTQSEDGVKMEAHLVESTLTDRKSRWNGVDVTSQLAHSYAKPVVVGQVMSYEDTAWSTFWSRGRSRTVGVQASDVVIGKHVGEDPDQQRAAETIGYLVIEGGTGTLDGVAFVAAVGSDSIDGLATNGNTYALAGVVEPTVAIASQSGMDGNDGSWAVLRGPNALGSNSIDLAVDEDQSRDRDRGHVTEQVAYLAFADSTPPGNSIPIARDDSYLLQQDGELSVAISEGVVGNDSDDDNDELVVSLVSDVTHGSLVLSGDGSFEYAPDEAFFGVDSFEYRVDDGNGGTDVGNVSLVVQQTVINSPPTAIDDDYRVFENDSLVISATAGVLANDSDVDEDDELIAQVIVDVEHGSLQLNADGAFTYEPDSDFVGVDGFRYEVSDSFGAVASASVVLDVQPVVATAGPRLLTGRLADVTNGEWTVVDLGQVYQSMVVVATPSYEYSSVPLITRIRNASGAQFEVRVDRTDASSALASADVHFMVVEEGSYTEATDGVKLEAKRVDSTLTDRRGRWIGLDVTNDLAQAYTKPVVVGQVMSYNDPDWSTFWSRGNSRTSGVQPSRIVIGKHVGEDTDRVRAAETIGYIVIESGGGVVDGVAYVADVGSDSIDGLAASGSTYSFAGLANPDVAVASQTGMDGTDGSWAVLNGADAVGPTSLRLAVDEDQARDTERGHVTEQIAYLVFAQTPELNLRLNDVAHREIAASLDGLPDRNRSAIDRVFADFVELQ